MGDYEREEAREWQLVANESSKPPVPYVRLPQQLPRRQLPSTAIQQTSNRQQQAQLIVASEAFQPVPPLQKHMKSIVKPKTQTLASNGKAKRNKTVAGFLTSRDTYGRAAWRENEPFKDTFWFPEDFVQTSEKGGCSIDSVLQKLEQISSLTDTHIGLAMPLHPRIGVNIWGSKESVGRARKKLTNLVQNLLLELKGKRWAHIPSLSLKQRHALERRCEEELRKQHFRQTPPANETFKFSGYFDWPIEEYEPQHVLGNSFEALDAIRMENRCFIIFDAERSAFCVRGADPTRVKMALTRVRTTFCQVLAQGNEKLPSLYLFGALTGNSLKKQVHLKCYSNARFTNRIPSVTVELHGELMSGQAKIEREAAEKEIARTNVIKAERHISRVLDRLQYYRGFIKMRARLGTFVLTRYKAEEYLTISDFKAMTADSQFAAIVTPSLGNKKLEDEISVRISRASNYLLPADAITERLKDVKPTYTSITVLANPDGDGDIHVEAQFIIENNESVQVSMRCLRIDSPEEESSKLLDISFIDLDRPLAWNLEISASSLVDDTKIPGLSEFIGSIKLNTEIAIDQTSSRTDPFILYKTSILKIKLLQQQVSWRYHLQGSRYICELVKSQEFTPSSNFQPSGVEHPYLAEVPHTQWCLSVYHDKWDFLLGENANLSIGQQVSWINSIETFFPKPPSTADTTTYCLSGFEDFLKKLETMSTMVYEK